MAVAAISGTAFSQTTVDLGVIGRLDANPYFYFDGTRPDYTSGNSVLYTDLECSFGDNVALTFIGHWLNTDADKIPFKDTPNLYRNTFYSVNNWVDFCYFDFYAGNWTFRLGKDVMAVGGFEFDPYDWECTYDMTSLLWQNLSCYQWGGSVTYTTPSEKSNFMFQALSATNFNDFDVEGNICRWRPWQNGFGTYILNYRGEYGPVETSNSYGWMQTCGGRGNAVSGMEMLTLGARVACTERFKIGLEWQNRRDTAVKLNSFKDFFSQSTRAILTMQYVPSDKFELNLRGGYEYIGMGLEQDLWLDVETSPKCWSGGASFYYFPLKDSHDLRLEATVAGSSHLYTSYTKGITATIGILYNHTFHIVK